MEKNIKKFMQSVAIIKKSPYFRYALVIKEGRAI
jgi:hypothetical protein